MKSEELQAYARLAHVLRKDGVALDLMRFVNEDAYAISMLQLVMQSTDVEVLRLALNIGDMRRLLNGSRSGSAQAVNGQAIEPRDQGRTSAPAESTPKRYIRSLR